MPTLPAWLRETDHVGDYADLDPSLLASLRTPADETALVAAVETQLSGIAAAQNPHSVPVVSMRRRAHTPDVGQRAA